jgi:REP element-mobilizing transposase RayT
MPFTHTSLHFHLIFSTKGRHPLISETWRYRLHAYLGGLVRYLAGISDEISGTADHVHLLIGLRPTHCLAKVLQDVKSSSSKGFTMRSAPANLPGKQGTLALRSVHPRWRRFGSTYANKTRITVRGRFSKNTWSY